MTMLAAARFKARHHISLADTLIAAFALRQEAILVHKGPEFEVLATSIQQESLPINLNLFYSTYREWLKEPFLFGALLITISLAILPGSSHPNG